MPIVFYSQKQQVEEKQSSPSPGKPRLVLEDWLARGLISKAQIVSPTPLTPAEISIAHDPKYVHQVLTCQISNGFGSKSEEVAASLPWTTGSMVSAALWAFKTKISTVSLTSGFHHAGYANGSGFCTFNGLVIAAQILRLNGAKRIGILDLDQHFGNGTEDIKRKLDLKYLRHWTLGATDINADTAEGFLKDLPKIIKKKFGKCDALLYQAGADCHVEDPLGGRFTTEQLQRRDKIVFETCKQLSIPVAWNLAGGYQDPIGKVLTIHRNTVIEFLKTTGETYEKKKHGKGEVRYAKTA